MIWESQIEHKPKRDNGLSARVDIDKSSHIRRSGDFWVDRRPPNIACVFLLVVNYEYEWYGWLGGGWWCRGATGDRNLPPRAQ